VTFGGAAGRPDALPAFARGFGGLTPAREQSGRAGPLPHSIEDVAADGPEAGGRGERQAPDRMGAAVKPAARRAVSSARGDRGRPAAHRHSRVSPAAGRFSGQAHERQRRGGIIAQGKRPRAALGNNDETCMPPRASVPRPPPVLP
jgi:hypothetical protein